jgi:hypothetical protein
MAGVRNLLGCGRFDWWQLAHQGSWFIAAQNLDCVKTLIAAGVRQKMSDTYGL